MEGKLINISSSINQKSKQKSNNRDSIIKASVIIGKDGLFIGNIGCEEDPHNPQSFIPNNSIKYLIMEGGEIIGDVYAEEIILQGTAILKGNIISCKNMSAGLKAFYN